MCAVSVDILWRLQGCIPRGDMVKHWHCLHLMQRDLKFKASSLVALWSKRSSVGLGIVLSGRFFSAIHLPFLSYSSSSSLHPKQFTWKVQQQLIIDWSLSVLVESRICKYASLSPVGNFLVAGKGGSQWEEEERSQVGMATRPGCLHGLTRV